MLVACGMQRCHQEALKKNRVILAKQLVLQVLVEHMVEKDIITPEMVEMIQKEKQYLFPEEYRESKPLLLALCSGYCGEKSLEIAWDFSQRDGSALNTMQDGDTDLQRKQTGKKMTEVARRVHFRTQAKSGSFDRNVEFLNLLPKRGPNAFSAFCEALRETQQQHLEARILKTVSDLSHEIARLEHCHGSDLPFPVSESCNSKRPRWIGPMEVSLDNGDGHSIPPVKYCTPEFYRDHQHLAYKVVSEPRGLALILSNVSFSCEKDLEYRKGGDVDCASLEMLFKQLGYRVTVLPNRTAQEMQNALERFSKLPDHQYVDSCIVALLSHGVEGAVYGSDGKLLQLQEVFRLFDNANCPNLQNKPKMFFIQACRGDTFDQGVDQRDGKERSDSSGCEESDVNKEESLKLRLPTCSDMICGYACLKGTVAIRNTKHGSWYIEALTSVFAEDSRDTHVADMLVKVNRQIKQREAYAPDTEFHRCKEMSEYCSTLCRDLYLFPGYLPGK